MVKAREPIRIYRDNRSVDVEALFDTGSARSYVSVSVAEALGYELYPKSIIVPLAVESHEAEVIGYLAAFIEVAGYKLPEIYSMGVIKGLRVDAIVGIDVMEPYEIILEKDKVTLKRIPPNSFLSLKRRLRFRKGNISKR